jgi:hypothetical protein
VLDRARHQAPEESERQKDKPDALKADLVKRGGVLSR